MSAPRPRTAVPTYDTPKRYSYTSLTLWNSRGRGLGTPLASTSYQSDPQLLAAVREPVTPMTPPIARYANTRCPLTTSPPIRLTRLQYSKKMHGETREKAKRTRKEKAPGVKRETETKQARKFKLVMQHSTAMLRSVGVSQVIGLANMRSSISRVQGNGV